ncbi:Gfo/Idh/MocA family protein [Nocardia stercoris]|uniref:Gfo/Idh/MocA family protein n=1 Tax=Nocardia stercoris TaxID=2483361 RepID=UPI001319CC77|nr:Gfo/Idh/MocA family oxidoreductase [Nocardia stercoris]
MVLIGAGTRTHKVYLPWLSRSGAAVCVAVVDSDIGAAHRAAAQFTRAVAARPGDVESVIADTQPDLIIVAAPDAAHASYVRRSLTAAVTVLVEKPLTTTLSDALELARSVRSDRVLVATNFRSVNLNTWVRTSLQAGLIGTVRTVEFSYHLTTDHARSYLYRWHRHRAASGGLEITKACHHLDLLSWWLDATPTGVRGRMDRRLPAADYRATGADIHDTIEALITYDTGQTAQYTLQPGARHDSYTCTIEGTDGRLQIAYNAAAGPHEVHIRTGSHGTGWPRLIAREPGTHAGADARMLTALPSAARGGRSPSFATAAEAALTVATGSAIRESAETVRAVHIPNSLTAPENQPCRLSAPPTA